MARSLNKITLIGNVGNAPEIRTTPNGAKVAQFSLATSEQWKDNAGNKQERTDWHRCEAWNMGTSKLADLIEQYVAKGDKLYVEGKVQYRDWQDKDGNKRTSTEIKVRDVLFLGSKPGAAAPSDRTPQSHADAVGRMLEGDNEELPF